MVPNPTNPQHLNRYSYTLNNPIRATDPSGHCTETGKGDDYCHEEQKDWTDDVQTVDDGEGDVYYRNYEVEIAGSQYSQSDFLQLMLNHYDAFANGPTSQFNRSRTGPLVTGERIDVGGPGVSTAVYVGDITSNSFTLLTAKGHVEAGAIRFSVDTNEAGNLVVKIASESRAAKGWGNVYEYAGGKQIQTGVWGNFLSNAVGLSGGRYANITAQGRATGPNAITTTTTTSKTASHTIAPSRQMLAALSK